VVPAALHTFFYVIRRLEGEMGVAPRVWFALTQSLYRAMVTAYVAKQRVRPRALAIRSTG
jgi:hypothetical protein